jgi:hypothetical protein
MNCHLYTRLGASALEHHIKPVFLTKHFEKMVGILLCLSELFFWRFCPRTRRKAKHVVGKAVRFSEGEASLIDVNSNDT